MSDSQTPLERALSNIIGVFTRYATITERRGTGECAMLQPRERRVLSESGLRQLVKDQLPNMPMASDIVDDFFQGNENGQASFDQFVDLVSRILRMVYENQTQ